MSGNGILDTITNPNLVPGPGRPEKKTRVHGQIGIARETRAFYIVLVHSNGDHALRPTDLGKDKTTLSILLHSWST